ncbi:MAG: MATE family efflux transporter [Christensenellales bacterium]
MQLPKPLAFWRLPGDRSQFTQFSNKRLLRLLIPLAVEQLIVVSVSFIDAMMLSSIHQDAFGAISLVDMLNLLILQIFVAVGAGGAIIAAQYLGKRERENAITIANQTAFILVISSCLVTLVTLLANKGLLGAVYPHISASTMDYATQYFALAAISYPAYALYYGGASLLYAQSNSRASMFAALVMNLVKVLLNLLLIKVFHLGVMGIGLATLFSRMAGAFIVTRFLLNKESLIHYRRPLDFKLALQVDRRIFKVAGPTGVENFLFNFGKLIIGTIFAGFSSAMIAANAASGTISTIINVPSGAINLMTVTVISQCVGAGLYEEAEYNAKRVMRFHYGVQLIMALLIYFNIGTLVKIMGLGQEAAEISTGILKLYCVLSILCEPLSFGLPNTLRASGDNKYTMYASLTGMLAVRVGMSFLLVRVFHMQMDGIWLAMYFDWVVRAALFVRRFMSGKWKRRSLV